MYRELNIKFEYKNANKWKLCGEWNDGIIEKYYKSVHNNSFHNIKLEIINSVCEVILICNMRNSIFLYSVENWNINNIKKHYLEYISRYLSFSFWISKKMRNIKNIIIYIKIRININSVI